MRRLGARDILLTAAVNAASPSPVTFFYGGQAVIEGVLMRGRRRYAVAARKPDGSIVICQEVLRSRVYTSRFWRHRFLRGIAGLYETLHLGTRALEWSARVQIGEEVEIAPAAMRAALAVSLLFALGLLIGAPLLLGQLVHRGTQSIGTVLVEGVIRAVILLGYLLLIGRLRNIQRVFEYHGAEHKSINCLESGARLDVEHVRLASRLHPRCGTGFVLVVAFVSIIVFIPLGLLPVAERIALQILLVPLVASIAYEVIRGLTAIRHTSVGRILLAPVLATQLLSTREPDERQMEVAIRALDAVRADEGEAASTPLEGPLPVASS
jgi:uncharacterized protein YqhQ